MNIPFFLTYILPPLAGALIGYVTNKIAIIMLFRPYRTKRLFGIRLPFTPGIIPRQRYELSRSIARQVARELFTVEAVTEQMKMPGFQQGLDSAVRRTGNLAAKIPLRSIGNTEESHSDGSFSAVWHEIKASDGIHQLGTALLRGFSRSFLGTGEDGKDSDSRMGPAGEFTAGILKRQIDRRKKLEDVVTPHVRKALVAALGGLLPSLGELLVTWLDRDSTRKELHKRGVLLMRDAVETLSGIQRLVLIAGQYDRSLEERMSYLVDRFVRSLEESIQDPEVAETLVNTADEYLQKNASRQLEEFLSPRRIDELAEAVDTIFQGIDPFGADTGFSLERLFELLPEELTLGDLVRWNEEGADVLTPVLCQWITGLLTKAAPVALEVMEIEKLVIHRIDGLEIEQVESLLLAVIEKQLKWINVFGALLGAVIGGVQIILLSFRA